MNSKTELLTKPLSARAQHQLRMRPETTADKVAERLMRRLRREPACWHFRARYHLTSVEIVTPNRVLIVYATGKIEQALAVVNFGGEDRSDPFARTWINRSHALALTNAGAARRRGDLEEARRQLDRAHMMRTGNARPGAAKPREPRVVSWTREAAE